VRRGGVRGLVGLSALLAGVALGAGAAQAHATIQPREALAGGYFQAAINITHGCDGSPTTVVRIKLPDGVISVKPQMKPGWTVEITKRKVTGEPVMHGKSIIDTADEVVWRGGRLPDELFDSFGLLMKLPDTPGRTLYFPVVQECEKGELRWTEIPTGGHGADHMHEPAPAVLLKAKGS
jgi:uncharacterized protein YcnI